MNRKIREFFKRIFNKRTKLLVEKNNEDKTIENNKNNIQENTQNYDSQTDMYEYLIENFKSSKNYDKFIDSNIKLEEAKEDMQKMMKYLKTGKNE